MRTLLLGLLGLVALGALVFVWALLSDWLWGLAEAPMPGQPDYDPEWKP